jgi:putative N6-adenine-specific DNA methylase
MSENSAKMHLFALIIPPGLEDLALSEIQDKNIADFSIQDRSPGVIECEANTKTMLQMTLALKIPTRILLRLDNFKVRDFPKLFKKISKIEWSQWYVSTPEIIKVSANKSRLIHSDKIEKTIREGMEKYFKGNPPKQKWVEKVANCPMATLHAYLSEDIMQISLDLSGKELYTRGRTHVGKAPIRENLAAAFLKFSDFEKASHILDPMAGSGTLIFEAIHFLDPIINKKQAWESFKIFENLNKNELAEKAPIQARRFYANELDKNTYMALQENLSTKTTVTFSNEDAFTFKYPESIDLVIANPPWGERVKIKGGKRDFYLKILDKFKGRRICLILPRDNELPKEVLAKAKVLNLKSGGFPIIYACWDL